MSSYSGASRLRSVHSHPSPTPLESATLVLLMALVVLMPVSYRAGTDATHPHTIFQAMIDMVAGHPHHHHDDHDAASDDANAGHPGTGPAGETRSSSDQNHNATRRAPSDSSSPDIPTSLGMSNPIDDAASIHALGVLVAAILGRFGSRPLWDSVRGFSGVIPSLTPPPPRPA